MNKLPYKILEWDTDVFGYRIAKIFINSKNIHEETEIVQKLKKDNIKLAYWFINPNDFLTIDVALKNGGKLVDEKITFQKIITDNELFFNSNEVSNYTKPYISENIYKIAIQSSIYSRYRLDKNFKNDEYLILYNLWIKNSISKTIATDVFVYTEDDDEIGLITLNVKNNIGTIGLFSVDEKSRGKSVGKKLMQAVYSKMNDYQIQELNVATQKANKVACNFYEVQGFYIKDIVNVYHLWL